MKRVPEILLGLLLPLACWSAEELAKDPGEEVVSVHEMEGITVTATRVPIALSEVPIATEVFTSREIEESGASDVGELLESGVGIEVMDQGYMGSVSSMSIRGSSANQVLVLIDGRPANSISLGMADLSEIAIDNVKRVDVVRGPVSSLYGANALGGVVNVLTGSRSSDSRGQGRFEFGSHGKELYSASTSSFWRGLGFDISAQKRRYDGERENSDYWSEKISAKMSYSGIERVKADLAGALEVFDLGLPGPVPKEGEPALYGSEEVTSLSDRQKNFKGYVDLSIGAVVRKGVDGRLKVYYDRRDMDAHSVYQGFDTGSFTPYKAVENDEYIVSSIGTNMQLDTRPFFSTRLVFGLDAVLSELDAVQVVTNDSTGEVTETRWWFPADTTAGLYVETDWHPWRMLGVIGSTRYDWSQAYGSRVSPSIGLVYKPRHNARLKLSAGNAFRAPTLNDLYWPESPYARGNPDVKPEYGFGGEVRAEYEPIRHVSLSTSVFLREVDDLIEWSPDENWVWRPTNVNEFSSRGVELEIELEPVVDARVRGHISFISATQRSEETVAYDEYFMPVYGMVERTAAFRPGSEASVGASYKAPFGFDFQLGLDHTGRRVSYWQKVDTTGGSWEPVTKEKWLDERFLTNAGVGFHLGPQYFFVRVDNVFDADYDEQFGYELEDRNYPGPRRTYNFGMKLALD